MTVDGVDLPVSEQTEQMKVVGIDLDWRLAYQKHAMAVTKSCNYHAQAIRDVIMWRVASA